MDHSLLPNIKSATLPQKYEAAKVAIRECNQIDECKDWGDKAQALASYAKQADDKEMENTAMRIRARASRRCGELLGEFEKAHSNQHIKAKVQSDDTVTLHPDKSDNKTANFGHASFKPTQPTRTQAAREAGMSERQQVTAIRVARIPEPEFEAQVESETPPTIMSLAEQGTNKKPKPEPRREDYQSDVEWKMAKGIPVYEQRGITKKAFQAGMYFGPSVRNFAEETELYDPQDVVDGLHPEGRIAIRKHIKTIENYLIRIIEKL